MYRSASPDEESLVKAAKEFGVVLENRTADSISISILGKKENYDIVKVIFGLTSVSHILSWLTSHLHVNEWLLS